MDASLLTEYIKEKLASSVKEQRTIDHVTRILKEDAPYDQFESDDTLLIKWLDEALFRFLSGEPIQYVTGMATFLTLKLKVNPHVLIPRPETEELVSIAVKWLKTQSQPMNILDVGTGSGCIAIAIKKSIPDVKVSAIDIDEGALTCARENAMLQSVDINFLRMDALSSAMWISLPAYNMIISNPPYIDSTENDLMDESVLRHEPHTALFPDGPDSLIFYKRMIEYGYPKLTEGGKIFFECNNYSINELLNYCIKKGLTRTEVLCDMFGKERFLIITNVN